MKSVDSGLDAKGQEAKGQEAKGQEAKGQEAKGQEAKGQEAIASGQVLVTAMEVCNKGKVLVTFDHKVKLGLYRREIKGMTLTVDTMITKETYKILEEGVLVRGKKMVFHLLAVKDYTKKTLEEKLEKALYDPRHILQILSYFEEYGFVDDLRYVKQYFNTYAMSRSMRQMQAALMKKGIKEETIKAVLADRETEADEYQAALDQLIKKGRRYPIEELDLKLKEKLMASLARKGFGYDLIRKVMSDYLDLRRVEGESPYN